MISVISKNDNSGKKYLVPGFLSAGILSWLKEREASVVLHQFTPEIYQLILL